MVKHKIISILFLNSKRTNCNWYTTQVSIVTLKHSWGIQSTFRMSFLCCLLVNFFVLWKNYWIENWVFVLILKEIDLFKLGPQKVGIGWLIVKQWEDWKVKFCESFTQLHFRLFVVFLVDRQEQQQFMKRLHEEYIITRAAACYAKNSRSSSAWLFCFQICYMWEKRRPCTISSWNSVLSDTKIHSILSLSHNLSNFNFWLHRLFVH